MNVSCPSCGARYRIDDSKITGRGARVTCPKCAHRFDVRPGNRTPPAMASAPAAMDEEDDAPTTIMQHSSEMMQEFRRMAETGGDAQVADKPPVAATAKAPAPAASASASKASPSKAPASAPDKGGSKMGIVVLAVLALGAAAAWFFTNP